MDTPVLDFLRRYDAAGVTRFHMPGHKGKGPLGCEGWDITEVQGADALYEADGILAKSEANATALFGSRRTLYSTEGSSHCIRAMLYLALTNRPADAAPVIVAARNVHKTFVYAAALLDLDVVWLWPEESESICGCPISAAQLERTLAAMEAPPAAVYLTSPDYLGGMADISSLAEVCHRHGTLLLTDNAHGAYLRFLQPSLHPLDLGADLCCDSAHKTLSALTGGAYLHIGKHVPPAFAAHAKAALALFGSTSPSYLTMASLDACNAALAGEYPVRLRETADRADALKAALSDAGWEVVSGDPLRLTLRAPEGMTGTDLAQKLRNGGIECEYADGAMLVLMLSAENTAEELEKILLVLGRNTAPAAQRPKLPVARGEQVVSIRQALFAPHEIVPVEAAAERICGAPMVSCPPAIPIVVSGERIGEAALTLLRYYGVKQVDVLK